MENYYKPNFYNIAKKVINILVDKKFIVSIASFIVFSFRNRIIDFIKRFRGNTTTEKKLDKASSTTKNTEEGSTLEIESIGSNKEADIEPSPNKCNNQDIEESKIFKKEDKKEVKDQENKDPNNEKELYEAPIDSQPEVINAETITEETSTPTNATYLVPDYDSGEKSYMDSDEDFESYSFIDMENSTKETCPTEDYLYSDSDTDSDTEYDTETKICFENEADTILESLVTEPKAIRENASFQDFIPTFNEKLLNKSLDSIQKFFEKEIKKPAIKEAIENEPETFSKLVENFLHTRSLNLDTVFNVRETQGEKGNPKKIVLDYVTKKEKYKTRNKTRDDYFKMVQNRYSTLGLYHPFVTNYEKHSVVIDPKVRFMGFEVNKSQDLIATSVTFILKKLP